MAILSKDEAQALLKKVLSYSTDEPESPMSRFYVTKTFTEYGDPLAPFR